MAPGRTSRLPWHRAQRVRCADGSAYEYDWLCVSTGARPRLIAEHNPFVIGLRDTDSIDALRRRLASARRIVIVGNGGIALELVCVAYSGARPRTPVH